MFSTMYLVNKDYQCTITKSHELVYVFLLVNDG